VSPFFAIVKPMIASGFDYHKLEWNPPELTATDLQQAANDAPQR